MYSLIILIHRSEVDGTKSCEIQYNYNRSMFFWGENGRGKTPNHYIFNQGDKGVYKERDHININCATAQDSTQ